MLILLGSILATNIYSYCCNDFVNYMDIMGYRPSKVNNIINALNISTIIASYASSLYVSFAATMTKIGLYITGIILPKIASVFWWQPWVVAGLVVAAVAVVVTAVTITYNNIVAKADAKIRSIVKKGQSEQYWSANLKWGYVDIGRPLTYAQAVAEVKAGRSVFTVTKTQAEAVARAAGNGKDPMSHRKHRDLKGYYKHFHICDHANGGHVWYLFDY